MAKLSVVICVYNTDKNYFSECLKSVYNSSLEEMEVIVVDDGSTIDYSKIIKKYKDIKYFKIINQGILNARIFGIKKATSPYVCIVDSDDTLSFNYFEASLTKAIETDADVIINDWAFNTAKTKYYCLSDSNINSNYVNNGEEFLNKFFNQAGHEHSYYVLWNKIYKRELIQEAAENIEKLNYYTDIKFAEDVIINSFVFPNAKKVANVHLGFYYYRLHNTQHVTVKNVDKLKLIVNSMTLIFDTVENYLKEKNIFEKYKESFLKWKQFNCSINYNESKKFKIKELDQFLLEKYKDCKLEKLPKDYGKTYLKQKLLPENIEQIDIELKKIYYSNKHLKVFAKNKSYAKKTLISMKKIFNKNYIIVDIKQDANVIVSKEKISLKQRIIHNAFVYKVGMLLFPKGSKIRQYLKSKL